VSGCGQPDKGAPGLTLSPPNGELPIGASAQFVADGPIPPLRLNEKVQATVVCGPDAGQSQQVTVQTYGNSPSPGVPMAYFTVTNTGGAGTDLISVTVGSGADKVGPATISVTWVPPVDCGQPVQDLGYLLALQCTVEKAKPLVDTVLKVADCAIGVASFLAPAAKLAKLVDLVKTAGSAETAEQLAAAAAVNTPVAQFALDLKQINDEGIISFGQLESTLEDAKDLADFLRNFARLLSDIASRVDVSGIALDVANLTGLGSCVDLLAKVVTYGAPSSSSSGPTGDGPGPGGSSWTAAEAPYPANIYTGDPSTYVEGISCPSTAECVAVGTYPDDSGTKEMLALTWSGGSWTAAGVPLPANAAVDPEVEVPGLSCPSVDQCVAAGTYQDTSGGLVGLLLTWSNGAWSSASVPLPANAATSSAVSIYAVSCASVNDCVAGGSYTDSSGNTQGLLLTWSGGSWTAAEAPVPNDAASNPWAQIEGLSCPTTTQCVAVGSYGSQDAEGLLWTWSAGSWTVANLPALPGGANDSDSNLYGVSCPSASQCVAVGYYNDNQDGLLLTLSSGSWTAAEAPVPPGGSTPHVGAVSCASVNYCVAGGSYVDSSGQGQGLLLTLSGGSWTPAEALAPANAASDPSEQVEDMSCPSVNGCFGGGVYEDSNNTQTGLLLTDTG